MFKFFNIQYFLHYKLRIYIILIKFFYIKLLKYKKIKNKNNFLNNF